MEDDARRFAVFRLYAAASARATRRARRARAPFYATSAVVLRKMRDVFKMFSPYAAFLFDAPLNICLIDAAARRPTMVVMR